MRPVAPLPSYPRGFVVLHEENLKLGQALGVSSKYLYAIHPRTMAYLVRRWREKGQLRISDLQVGDNTTIPLMGSDIDRGLPRIPRSPRVLPAKSHQ